ncbi:MAG: hypothetical protein ACREHD_01575 [Pirellulales bacterium]
MSALKSQDTAKKATKAHSFTIYLDGVKTLTDRLANRLYEAGCADATIAFQNGELAIDYDRTAASLDKALASAVRELLHHGYRIRRIEVARPRQRASLNETGKRRPRASA